ncbi:MAG: hypothetical protein AAF311_07760 [Pseudomonadota bacterium]
MTIQGRQLPIGPTDNTSAQRTPSQRLHPIPEAARESFVPAFSAPPILQDLENDLTRLSQDGPVADGTVIDVSGRIRSSSGLPVRDALIELWNANTFGRYTHIDDQSNLPLDPNFTGFGRVATDEHGAYRFRTILPGQYLARADIGRWRPRHLHFSIQGGTSRLVTQMYFDGDPHNSKDPGYILLGDAADRHIGQELSPNQYEFDIVIGGRNATYLTDHG